MPKIKPVPEAIPGKKQQKIEALAETVRAILHYLDTKNRNKSAPRTIIGVCREIAEQYTLTAWPVGSEGPTRRNATQVSEALQDLVRKHCTDPGSTAQDLIARGSVIVNSARLAEVQYGQINPPLAQGACANDGGSPLHVRPSVMRGEMLKAPLKHLSRSPSVLRSKRKPSRQSQRPKASAPSERSRVVSRDIEEESDAADDDMTGGLYSVDEAGSMADTSVPYPDATHYALEHVTCQRDLLRLLDQVISKVGVLLAPMTWSRQPVQINSSPCDELRALYSTILGRELCTRNMVLISARLLATDLISIMVAVFLYREVFEGLPVLSTTARLAVMRKVGMGETIDGFENELDKFRTSRRPRSDACAATNIFQIPISILSVDVLVTTGSGAKSSELVPLNKAARSLLKSCEEFSFSTYRWTRPYAVTRSG